MLSFAHEEEDQELAGLSASAAPEVPIDRSNHVRFLENSNRFHSNTCTPSVDRIPQIPSYWNEVTRMNSLTYIQIKYITTTILKIVRRPQAYRCHQLITTLFHFSIDIVVSNNKQLISPECSHTCKSTRRIKCSNNN